MPTRVLKNRDGMIKVTQVEKKMMEFDTDDEDGDIKLRCIRQRVRTERTIEADEKCAADINNIAATGAFGISGAKRPMAIEDYQNMSAEREKFRDFSATSGNSTAQQLWLQFSRVASLKWWSIPAIIGVCAVLFFFSSRLSGASMKRIFDGREPNANEFLSDEWKDVVYSEIEKRTNLTLSNLTYFDADEIVGRLRVEMKLHVSEVTKELVAATKDRVLHEISSLSEEYSKKISLLADQIEKLRASLAETSERFARDDDRRQSYEQCEELIHRALEVYDADKTGMHDFALETAGATIISEKCSDTFRKSFLGIPLFGEAYGPRTVIQRRIGPSTGECWPFQGDSGRLAVRLSQPVNVTAVSYEHLPLRLSANRSINSAPKKFQVWGYHEDDELNTRRMIGEYRYSNTGPALQMFETQAVISPVAVNVIEFRVLSNYGSPYTCLYRFRVHGISAESAEKVEY